MRILTPFTFVRDWYLNCQFAGLIWAQARGLYAAAGDVGLERLGYLSHDRWQRNLTAYRQFGMIEQVATVEQVVDNRFVATTNSATDIDSL